MLWQVNPKPIPFNVIHSGNTINPDAISELYTPVPVVPIIALANCISLKRIEQMIMF